MLMASPVTFALVSIAAWLALVLLATVRAGRFLATFIAVLLGIQVAVTAALWHAAAPVQIPFACLQAAVFVHFARLVWLAGAGADATPRLPGLAYRALVGVPASFFVAGTFLAFPWALAAAVGLPPLAAILPYILAALGTADSLRRPPPRAVDVVLDEEHVPALARWRPRAGTSERPLHVVQITDPHLGTFMSVARLREVCARAVAAQPDLVLLTGDYLTVESHHGGGDTLARALEPLRALPGRVFACRGNHDLEAPVAVARGLASAGARLLIDELVSVDTAAGPVEILGIDWGSRPADVASRHPRGGALRLVLLHNPGAFRRLPDGAADLVLSGHTHGGQLGLVTFGLPHTILSLFGVMPDHGLWALGTNRLYVHRGTGHYGFPVRIGVSSEESVLRVHPRGMTGLSWTNPQP